MTELENKLKSSHPIPRRWTPQEDADLLLAIKSSSREEVAKQMNRTLNAIVHRLKKIATRMNKSDESLGKILEATKLTTNEISDAVKADAEQATNKSKKKSNKSYAAATSHGGHDTSSSEQRIEASLARIEVLLQKLIEK